MKLFKLLLLLLLLGCTRSKNELAKYDKLFYDGMIDYHNENYKKASKKLRKAINILPSEQSSTYLYASASELHLGEVENAQKLIIESITQSNTNLDYLNNFKEFEKFEPKDLLKEINLNYQSYTEEYHETLAHPHIQKTLDSLIQEDQRVRINRQFREDMRLVDSLNVWRLMKITEKYGWQSKGWLILWHQRGNYNDVSNWVWDYFKPKINKEITEGKIRKSFWAQFEEFINVTENGYQEYGLYPHNFDDYPLKNTHAVDKKRDSVNLPPLWVMNRIYDWPLPDNYVKQESM